MTPNTRAKIVPALLLAIPAPLVAFLPGLLGLPAATALFYGVAAFTVVLAFALAGASDLDGARRDFHGGAPAYWIPATVWLATVTAAILVPMSAPEGARWVIFAAGALQALASFGACVKNR